MTKCDYDEEEELNKVVWRALNWRHVSKKVIREKVKRGWDVNELCGDVLESITPLFYACGKNNREAVKALLELGADPNIKGLDTNPLNRHRDNYCGGFYPSISLIDRVDDIKIARDLIVHGAKVTPVQMREVELRDKERRGIPVERVAKHSKIKIGKAILKQNQRG